MKGGEKKEPCLAKTLWLASVRKKAVELTQLVLARWYRWPVFLTYMILKFDSIMKTGNTFCCMPQLTMVSQPMCNNMKREHVSFIDKSLLF